MKTFEIDEAAAFLNIGRTHALTLAGSGELPGAKIGREWVFLENDLVEYLQAEVRKQVRERRARATVSQDLDAAVSNIMPSVSKSKVKTRKPLPDLSQY
ncbi:helix-turn-helix domain-containing protein [Undibacterium sp. RTI2.1]|uniref:helix-turn-helix domain-containing protein n=1 Tax=unclassified Undibacterium TaxID=2630295 RepID=UPI002AB5504E|nr:MULTISPECIES: helix-turn-helix domain-containing protein [unclassified Undibacterium]MDY7537520.1 helix-turn-helix domain-containing protein [Undibacterium sp. 5I1]MEB0032998.1 helix-turn-helix domain-containing protein [Undibacterium sp. RTI2.1]MEB0115426.1 helix-turn-helix domain-containing protein [Undibacterium sp. RTI2.2]MEB0232899.1 helix-turn-helix domain-containing protein [Undibacterium sp. 10I3]MEB0256255.1 helix-turn-helix domain-containing protein [Undibacterium sp. 5I1]